MSKPNILYLHSHDTGRYIQPYGHAVHTPNLQRLAEEGVLFRQAFTVNPTCSPSRAALLTGQRALNSGMIGLAHRGFQLHDYKQHVANALRTGGYVSALAGVQHIISGKRVGDIGYDRVLDTNNQKGYESAIEYLDNAPSEPFFLSCGFSHTHREFPMEHPEDDVRYTLPPAPLPDTPETRKDMARFKACARELDRRMGLVLEALERNGLAENTLVVCTTDHGIAFPRMKCNLEDSGTGVMLIVRGPGGFGGGKVVDAMVTHMDIYPTLCDLVGVDHPDWLQGKSLLPLVDGSTEKLHDAIFTEVNWHASYEPKRAVRTDRYKLVRRFDGRKTAVLPNCDAGESKSYWMDNDWPHQPVYKEALFDLVFDPNETNNLIDRPEMAEVASDLRARLEKWMRETGDPLLEGPVEAPEDAVANPVDDVNPSTETASSDHLATTYEW